MSIVNRVQIVMIVAAILMSISMFIAEKKAKDGYWPARVASDLALVFAGCMAGALFAGGWGHLVGIVTFETVMATLQTIGVLVFGGAAIEIIRRIKKLQTGTRYVVNATRTEFIEFFTTRDKAPKLDPGCYKLIYSWAEDNGEDEEQTTLEVEKSDGSLVLVAEYDEGHSVFITANGLLPAALIEAIPHLRLIFEKADDEESDDGAAVLNLTVKAQNKVEITPYGVFAAAMVAAYGFLLGYCIGAPIQAQVAGLAGASAVCLLANERARNTRPLRARLIAAASHTPTSKWGALRKLSFKTEWGDVGYYLAQSFSFCWAFYALVTPPRVIQAAAGKFERQAGLEQ